MLATVVVLGLAACASPDGSSQATRPTAGTVTTVAETSTTTIGDSNGSGPSPRPEIRKEDFEVILAPILHDAADRAGVEVGEARVETFEYVEWPDRSLGCPQPGQMYAQVVTPGYRFVIQAGSERFDYRSDESGDWVFCERL